MLTLDKPALYPMQPAIPAKPIAQHAHVTLAQVFKALRSQSRNNMTYSKIMDALECGKQVHWTSMRYSVKLDSVSGKLCIKDVRTAAQRG